MLGETIPSNNSDKEVEVAHNPVLAKLAELGYQYKLYMHAEVSTTAESDREHKRLGIEGPLAKNLFIKDKKDNFYLISTLADKQIKLNEGLKAVLSSITRLSFATPEELNTYLGVESGAVSPFALINDKNKKITFALDNDLLKHDSQNFHPNNKSMTVNMKTESFVSFITKVHKEPKIVSI